MNYTLHQLQIFLEVTKEQSITKAAEKMHMTQPALSIQLKNFQRQFNVPLTEVIGRQLYVTDFGWQIAELAANVLRESEAIKFKTKEYEGLLSGELRISSASTGKYVMPYFLSGFVAEHSGLDLILDVSNKSDVIKKLSRNEVDFALVSVKPEGIPCHEEFLLENKLYLVGNTDEFDESKPLIFREEGSATRQVMDHYFGVGQSRKSMTLTSNEAVKQAVVAGLGYSIIPKIGIRHELESGEVKIIPSKGLPIKTTWRLIWLRDKKLSPIAEAYLEFVRENKASIIQSNFLGL